MKAAIRSIEKLLRLAGGALALMCVFGVMTENREALAANRALVVGVGKAPFQKPLNGTKNDVERFRTLLIGTGLFSAQEIKTLLEEKATKANVLGDFKQWLIEGSSPGDTVLFFFSGHGCQVWDENGDEEDGKDEALCCWDSRIIGKKTRRAGWTGEAFEPASAKNLLIDDEIHDMLKQLGGRRVIFVSDSCHSGTVYKGIDPFFVQVKTIDEPIGYKSVFEARTSSFPEETRTGKPVGVVDKIQIPGVELAAFTASQDSQLAREIYSKAEPKGHHGLFTWCLIHGLTEAQRRSRDGAVTFGELAEFLRESVQKIAKRLGRVQNPQAVFNPKSLADQPLLQRRAGAAQPPAPTTPPPEPVIERPTGLACFIEKGAGVSSSDVGKFKSKVERSVPGVRWTTKKDGVSCKIALEKKSGTYGARISDASGDYWETNKGTDLDAVASALACNVRAYFIQNVLAALRNPSGQRQVAINITVKGPKPRSQGEAVEGDALLFEAETKTGGYPYIFNVDTLGVIHPLYPLPNTKAEQLSPGTRDFLGSSDSFVVAEPFGKEMVFAVMLDKPSSALTSLWTQDHIGDAKQESFIPQQRFLDTLWSELVASGKPKGDWTSQSLSMCSFHQ